MRLLAIIAVVSNDFYLQSQSSLDTIFFTYILLFLFYKIQTQGVSLVTDNPQDTNRVGNSTLSVCIGVTEMEPDTATDADESPCALGHGETIRQRLCIFCYLDLLRSYHKHALH